MKFKFTIFSLIVGMIVLFMSGCVDRDPSVLKIFVRSSANILTPDAQVRIVGKIDMDTPEFQAEVRTNESGVATFELDELFDQYAKSDAKVAHFTVYAKDTSEFFSITEARAKQHLTSTETINMNE